MELDVAIQALHLGLEIMHRAGRPEEAVIGLLVLAVFTAVAAHAPERRPHVPFEKTADDDSRTDS